MKIPAGRASLNLTVFCKLAGMACLFLLTATEPVFSQLSVSMKPPAGSVDSVAVEDLKTLAAKIENSRERKQLLSQIRALIALQNQSISPVPEKSFSARLTEAISKTLEETSLSLSSFYRYIPDRQELVNWLQKNIRDPDSLGRLSGQARPILLILALAWISEFIVERLLARFRKRIEARAVKNHLTAFGPVFARAALRFCAPAMFTIVAFSAFFFLQSGAPIGNLAIQIFSVYITGRILVILARMVLAPSVPSLRLVPLRSESSIALFLWIRRLLIVALIGYLLASTALLFGLPAKGFSDLMDLLGLVLLVTMIIGILRNRTAMTLWIRGSIEGQIAPRAFSRRVRVSLASVWHLLAIIYLISAFVVWWQDIDGGFLYLVRGTLLSTLLLFAIRLAIKSMRRGITRNIDANDSLHEKFPIL
ncbi:MAG: hypothetical protein EHM73_15230, partial [Chroococcales cyanobacterium metabat2.561]